MFARLSFAFIGMVVSAIAGAIAWWVLGFAFGYAGFRSARVVELVTVAKYMGLFGAVIGFIFKDRVGDFAGSVIQLAFHAQMGTSSREPWHAPAWLVVVVLVAVVASVWHFAR
jgi:hypothetical protein